MKRLAWQAHDGKDVPVTIDADSRVPWKDVMTVMNLAKREGVGKIEFAFGPK
jgi:biopolymer transport protein ExbD